MTQLDIRTPRSQKYYFARLALFMLTSLHFKIRANPSNFILFIFTTGFASTTNRADDTDVMSTKKTSKAKARIRCTAWGNWYGYIGNRKVELFMNNENGTQEENARHWLTQAKAGERTHEAGCMGNYDYRDCGCKAKTVNLLDVLRHHVSGAIERGEAEAIVNQSGDDREKICATIASAERLA
jgi:hypothetical protein